MAKANQPEVKTKGSYHHGNLRRALVDAARLIAETEGSEGVTLRAAARRVGVSQTAPYRHFDSKAALMAAVATEGFEQLEKELQEVRAEHPDAPGEALKQLAVAYVKFAMQEPSLYSIMFGNEIGDATAHPELKDSVMRTFAVLVTAIDECQAAGIARKQDAFRLAMVSWASVHGLAQGVASGQVGFFGLGNSEALALAELAAETLSHGYFL